MLKETLDEVKTRKNFYRDTYYRTLKMFLFVELLLLGIIGLSTYVYTHRPATDYYSTNSVGFVLPLKALDAPNMSSTALLKPDPPSLTDGSLKQLDV